MQLRHVTGSIADFHARVIPDDLAEAEVWSFRPSGSALVLGSAQDHTTASAAATAAAGVDVVRRRSGGGAVHVDPARSVWLDVVVPRHDEHWSDDVRESTYWLGEAWQRALATLGIASELYRGGLEQTPWGRLVCFAALGPGEVLVDGRKLVGISQRRTRAGARFQCIAYDRWDPYDVLDLLDLTAADRAAAGADLADRAAGVGDRLDELRAAVLDDLVADR
ncbi:lipoate--protein ligase family protein [Nocardioides nitrophenolicus]|uniref:lipoate--protein ligase family protein n=1 Tax=Nocardioides nitrophenolicus TaxID=60489 RepID=UPI001957C17F|nr:lipoate--protein ligase family protein [Nocardioides nitrophenolicus]MBM7517047.1 lipoate-protein ligase A [Nocardioides nitrophenolicus]